MYEIGKRILIFRTSYLLFRTSYFLFRTCSLLTALCLTSAVHAQQFGGNSPSLKWKQINTDTARIIFPPGLEIQAQQVASIVHALSRATLSTAGGRQHKVDIIFQNQTTHCQRQCQSCPFQERIPVNGGTE